MTQTFDFCHNRSHLLVCTIGAIVLFSCLIGCGTSSDSSASNVAVEDSSSKEALADKANSNNSQSPNLKDASPSKDSEQETEMQGEASFTIKKPAGSVRFATFNVALNRKNAGDLLTELEAEGSQKVRQVAEIIQRIRPDVLLLNEVDFDGGKTAESFHDTFLAKSQNGQSPIEYRYVYTQAVNTGVDSKLDFNGDGKTGTPEDAFGYGVFPGQYGMVVFSNLEIDLKNVRTFQKFLWKDMPGGLWPIDPATDKPYYSDEAKAVFRLSSKSHWDLPVMMDDEIIHFLVCHPTPPVFDRDEDRNGRRNHDEIRFWADYISGKGDYIYDDAGKKGGLMEGASFVIAGDLNADPNDGDSTNGAGSILTTHERVNHSFTPQSTGGAMYAESQAGANESHQGNPMFDTGDFNDARVGNMRIDYVLPSTSLKVTNHGVYWPKPDEEGGDLVTASDHRLVWIDIER